MTREKTVTIDSASTTGSIRSVQLRPTYDFAPLSKDALAFEPTAIFKAFILRRLENVFGSYHSITIPDAEVVGHEDVFRDDRKLVRFVRGQIEKRTAGKISVREDEPVRGPVCYPDPEGGPEWIRERGIRVVSGSGRSEPLLVGRGIDGDLPALPEFVRTEAAGLRLYLLVAWKQSYGIASPDES